MLIYIYKIKQGYVLYRLLPDPHVLTPFFSLPLRGTSSLCDAKRGNSLLYNEIAPPLYEVERGLGGEYIRISYHGLPVP